VYPHEIVIGDVQRNRRPEIRSLLREPQREPRESSHEGSDRKIISFNMACAYRHQIPYAGHTVLRRGWPDFLVINQDWDRGFALEHKSPKDKLSTHQKLMHRALASFGIATFVARDNFAGIVRKKGRQLLTPNSLNRLKDDCDDLVISKNQLERDIEELRQEIELATVLMDGVPLKAKPKSVNARWLFSRQLDDLLFG